MNELVTFCANGGKSHGKGCVEVPQGGGAKREVAATGSIPARRGRSEWVRKKPRGMKEPDRCLDEDEGSNSIARMGSGTSGLSNPTGHM